jgi:hypothetical protein
MKNWTKGLPLVRENDGLFENDERRLQRRRMPSSGIAPRTAK